MAERASRSRARRLARGVAIAMLVALNFAIYFKGVRELRARVLGADGALLDDWRRSGLGGPEDCRARYGRPAPSLCLVPNLRVGEVVIDGDALFETPSPAPAEADATVVCLGGATTQGVKEQWRSSGYPSTLARSLARDWPRRRIAVRNAGLAGSGACDLRIRFERDVRPTRPELLVLLPEPRAFEREPIDTIAAELRRIVDGARADGTTVLLGLPPVHEECRRKPPRDPEAPALPSPPAPEAAERLHAALVALGEGDGVRVVDHRRRFADHPFGCELFAPTGELNRLGEDLVAVELAHAVAAELRERVR